MRCQARCLTCGVADQPFCTLSYGRVETLSGFANGIFLILISIFIVFEAIQRLIDPPEMNTNQLLVISMAGLAVNLVGMFATGHHHHGHSVSPGCTRDIKVYGADADLDGPFQHGGHDHDHGHGTSATSAPLHPGLIMLRKLAFRLQGIRTTCMASSS